MLMTTWTGRNKPDTSWIGRIKPGENCMSIIITGFYDGLPNWEDNKIWWDDGILGTKWTGRTIPN